MASIAHLKRQAFENNNDNNDDGYGYGYGYGGSHQSWWWTPAGMATRYTIAAILFAAILAFFVGGYYHAKRRLRKGQAPLAYHRWMVRRQQVYYPPQPRNAWPHDPNAPGYGPNQGPSYNMEAYAPPPPAYNNAEVPPPVYQPPQGATKAMADQNFAQTNRAGESSASAGVAEPSASARQ